MIKSFKTSETRKVFERERVAKFGLHLQKAAQRKLVQLQAATTLEELKIPPGNRLEALKGDRKGEHSIRIDGQFRICFVWKDGNALDVEIVDYHREKP